MTTDVTNEAQTFFAGEVLKAERNGTNTLILVKLDHANGVTLDRSERRNRYQIHYRWHQSPDSPLTSVMGTENTYWPRKDVAEILRKANPKSLFDVFNLF